MISSIHLYRFYKSHNDIRYGCRLSNFGHCMPLLHLCWLGAAGSSHIGLQQASQTRPRPGRPGIRVSLVTNADRFLHFFWEFAGNSVGIYRLKCTNCQDGGLFQMGQTTDLWWGGCKAIAIKTSSSRALGRSGKCSSAVLLFGHSAVL